jgi:tRNA-binding EMAP/Myf-like protein
MKFSLSWLNDHLVTKASLQDILDLMLKAGLEVEEVTDPREKLAPFTVCKVIEAKPHPDADKLRVCTVETVDGVKQIVCGAPNARTGMTAIYAPLGTFIPGLDFALDKKPRAIRGIESHGMMCSSRELEVGEDTSSAQDAYAVADLDVMTGKVSNVQVFRKMPVLPRLSSSPTLRIIGMSPNQKSVVYVTRSLVKTNTDQNISTWQLYRHDLDSGKEEKSEDIRYAPLLTIAPQQVFPDLKRFVHVLNDWIVISDLDGSNPQRLLNFKEALPKGEVSFAF